MTVPRRCESQLPGSARGGGPTALWPHSWKLLYKKLGFDVLMKTELELALNVSQRISGTGRKAHMDKRLAGLERLGDISSPGLSRGLSSRRGPWAGLGSKVTARGGDTPVFLGPGRPEMGCAQTSVYPSHGSQGQKPELGFGEGPICAKRDLSEPPGPLCANATQSGQEVNQLMHSVPPSLVSGVEASTLQASPGPQSLRASWSEPQTGLNPRLCVTVPPVVNILYWDGSYMGLWNTQDQAPPSQDPKFNLLGKVLFAS